MKIYDFKVILEPDEDGGYIISCPLLPGCYTQGETVQEAMANIREVILLVLEDMEEQGLPVPDPSGALVGSVAVAV